MTMRPLQDQVNDIAVFGLSLVLLGFMTRMVRDLVTDALDAGKPAKRIPQTKAATATCPTCDICPICDICPSYNPAVRLVGIGERPLRPEMILEREEEKLERRRLGLKPGTHIRPPLTPEEDARLRELRAQGLTYKEIAERTGLPKITVYNAIKRTRPRVKRAITFDRLVDVMKLRRRGLPLEEIGRQLGITKAYVHYLLHRLGERIDIVKAATDLQAQLRAVGDRLHPPATIPKLKSAADDLVEIADDGQVLLEIMPYYPVLGPQPGDIVVWALLAEEVLRTGVWCCEQRQRGYEIRTVPVASTTMEVRVEMTPRRKELLGSCSEAAMDAAKGTIEQRPGYETKSAQILLIVEEMMMEVKEE